ncbi:hypothetical protein CK203_114043 [Vitis vinifera]|uniref:Integrase catalytic domain-containing protein n=1 Tax=Vitis vinifera TaxID=29760 RepID=A0A438FF61_VITVI|nr:hypothetical protein CK203_114043 [Vitis vinifera]
MTFSMGHMIPFGATRAWSPSWWLVSGQNLVSSFQSSERVDDLDEKPMSGEDESIQRLNRSEDFLDNNFFRNDHSSCFPKLFRCGYLLSFLLNGALPILESSTLFSSQNQPPSSPTSEDRPVVDDFPDEEFVAMTSLSRWSVCLAFSDRYPATNNIVEYEACILGLETALELDFRQMEVFGDSNLVLRQIQGDWKTRDVKLRPYHAYLELLVARFDDLRYVHLHRAQNRSAPAYCCLIGETEAQDDLPWYHDIYQFLRSGIYPEVATAKDRKALRNLATRFVICGDTLYRRSADGMLLLCLDRASADRVMREIGCQFVQKCLECQIHGDLIHALPSELHALTSPWPFSVWVLTLLGRFHQKSSSGHGFILVAIDYFTKWVEAASYARLTSARVASFIRSHIICRCGVPHELISDRGGALRAESGLRLGFDQLNLLDEKRLRAADHVQAYQRKMARAFKKRVKPRPLQKGDLVLRILRGLVGDPEESLDLVGVGLMLFES